MIRKAEYKFRGNTAIGMILLLLGGLMFVLPASSNAGTRSAGKKIPAVASAQYFAPGFDPKLATDENDATLWIANLTPDRSNNNVWFQLDFGSVKQVARLHWLAAAGTPYPASAPNKYKVAVSVDGEEWTTVFNVPAGNANEPAGNILLNTEARYVRLITSQVNDGTGWSLGLREIWVTEGRDNTADLLRWQMRAVMTDRRITLSWQPPKDPRVKFLRLYRSTSPTDPQGESLAVTGASRREYTDAVPNWTPYYYWVRALNEQNEVLSLSSKVAAFAHPTGSDAERIETFAFWYETYKSRTHPDSSLRHIGNAAFVVSDEADAIVDLAKAGIGALPYITLYQTHVWTETFPKNADLNSVAEKIAPIAFYRKSADFSGSPSGYVPTIFCRPGNIEYNPQAIQYTTCPNSAPFREMVLAYVHKQLSAGASGFFVDNGYEDDIAASSVCQSTKHSHYYGDDLTSADAFLGLLMEITCAVKRKNPQGVVIVNGGVPGRSDFYGLKLAHVTEGQLWESYLRSSYNTLKEHVYEWGQVYRDSVDMEKSWLALPPRRTFVLSYPWNRDEAFFCYATAKLCNLPWSAGLGISDPDHSSFGGHFGTYPELINLRLGRPEDVHQYGGVKSGEVYMRSYEQGIVLVNPSQQDQRFVLPPRGNRNFVDVFSGNDLTDERNTVTLPPESGRVYLYR